MRKALVFLIITAAAALAGRLKVEILPEEANKLGAKWSVKGNPHVSGEIIENTPGQCNVTFSDIPGWKTPAPWKIEIQDGHLNCISATYTKYLPDNTQIWREIDVYRKGRLLRRLVIVARETGNDNYNFNEEVSITADSIGEADAWLERDGRLLERDECRLAPTTEWCLAIKNPSPDEGIILKWNLWHVETDTSVILESDAGILCSMSDTSEYKTETAGIQKYKIRLKQENMRSREYILAPGWNPIGIDMLPGPQSLERLAAFTAFTFDRENKCLVKYRPSSESAGVWIYSPSAASLYLMGKPCKPAEQSHGWNFFCVEEECSRQAWQWNGKSYAPVYHLKPGIGYWEHLPK